MAGKAKAGSSKPGAAQNREQALELALAQIDKAYGLSLIHI